MAKLQNNLPIDSDSQDSDQQQSSNFKQLTRINNKKFIPFTICIIICIILAICVFLFLIYLHEVYQKQQSNVYNRTKYSQNEHLVQDQQDQVDPMKKQSSISPSQNVIKKRFDPLPVNNTLTLPVLSPVKQFGDTYFLHHQIRQPKMDWFSHRQIVCQPDKIINSASKISQNAFLQRTAYEDINVILQDIEIPAENIYRLEGIRQLLQNLSKSLTTVIAFDHNHPLVLVIATIYSKNGIFVSNDSNWQLFQNNLIINDVLPIAKPIPFDLMLNSKGYNIMITNNCSLVRSILYEGRREILLIVEVNIPIQIQTYVLLALKVYRIQQKGQCQVREIEIYEQSSWHFDNKTTLLPDWYIFTIDSLPLPLHFQKKQYRKPLSNPRHIKCLKKQIFKQQYLSINSDFSIKTLPFEGIHLLTSKQSQQPTVYFKQLLIYFTTNPPKQIYIHSGPYVLMMLIISTSKTQFAYISQNYKDKVLLKKNLVLNNLQISFEKMKGEIETELIITDNIKQIAQFKTKNILLIVQQAIESQSLSQYKLQKFIQKQQCQATITQPVNTMDIPAGVYLLTNIN